MIVTIVTPSFNQAEFIEETIRSVLVQEGDFYLDYIIMDGGSTDGSVNIIKKYAELIHNKKWKVNCQGIEYRWLSQKDDGQAHAISMGFEMARGEIGGWLNSDDYLYDANSLARVVAHFSTNPALELLIGEGYFVDKKGVPLWRWHTEDIDWKELIYLDYHILQPASFFKLHLTRIHPLISGYNYCFDQEFFAGLLYNGVHYIKIDDDIACLRSYPQTKTMSGGERRFREAVQIMKKYGHNPFYRWLGMLYQYMMLVWVDNRIAKDRSVEMVPCFRNLFYHIILRKRAR